MQQHKAHTSCSDGQQNTIDCAENLHDHEHHKHSCCQASESVDLTDNPIPTSTANQAVYLITHMDCPTEETLIRKKLSSIAGIVALEFNLMQRILTIHHHQANLVAIEEALIAIDMAPKMIVNNNNDDHSADFTPTTNWLKLGCAAMLALGAEIVHYLNGAALLVFALAIAAILVGGLGTYKKGWIALKNLNLNMNALMSFAVTGAILIRQWPEAAMVMVLFSLAEAIEAKSMDRARNAIKNLLSLTPETATVLQTDGSWLEMDVKRVPVGSILRVKPGERIALDGEIVLGQSTIDQAPITGESLPIDKTVGDQIFAGTINQSGSFEYKVTALSTQSTLARIIKAVESAQSSKAQTQRFVDRFAKIYTPTVFIIALSVGIIPPLFFNGIWFDWIYKSLVLLVISCPCALVISTPVTIVSGLAAATRYGILIKGGMYLEQGRKLSALALDKTGTITYGKPKQTHFIALGSLSANQTQTIAASLAVRSDHPVSKAIALAAKEENISPLNVINFSAILGQGTQGEINGEWWYLGNHRMVKALGLSSDQLASQIEQLEQQGNSVVMLIGQGAVYGLFALADTIKESSIEAIDQLKKLAIKTIMLTGDNVHTAKAIAKQAGIDQVKGNLLPEDKLLAITDLTSSGVTGMVGDGINDAPALAKSDIGFAMGAAGTDTAIETADIALMDDDLRKIPKFIQLSKSTFAILVQNIVFALSVKLIFFVLTFLGETTMWMAVFADIGTSLLVVANGLRLLKK